MAPIIATTRLSANPERHLMTEFRIPLSPEDLQTKPHDFPLAVSLDHDLRFSDDLAERVVHDLGFNEPTCLLEQTPFDAAYVVAKSTRRRHVSTEAVNTFLEAINANLKILAAQIPSLTDAEERVLYRSALKVYIFFMNWIWTQAEAQHTAQLSFTPRKRQPSQPTRGRKSTRAQFNWKSLIEDSLSALAAVLALDLGSLFHPTEIDRQMLDLCLTMGVRGLRHWEALRSTELREGVFQVLAACAVRHGMEAPTASALVLAAQKADQLPSIVAEIALFANERFSEDTLTRALVEEFTKSAPHDYSAQWEASKGRSQVVKTLSKLLECLSDAVPLALLKQSSALEPYWCCTAYPIRSALVSVLAALILALDSTNGATKLQQQRQMLDRLLQRFADTNAFTRSRCVSAWVQLTQRKCVPLEYWLEVTRLAAERLHDCASTVRKSSLCLLKALVEYNPFGVNMNTERFRATLELYKRRLQDYPPEQRDLENGDAEVAPRRSLAETGNYQQLCFVVQQLETAVAFTEMLSATLQPCRTLLHSPSVTVAQEVLHYLTVCKQFSVRGVESVIKAAFALIFSREPTLRDELLTAFQQLYTAAEDDLATAQNWVLLTLGATTGELTCLEEILKTLHLQGRVSEKVVKLWILIGLDRDTMPVPISTPHKVKGAVFCLCVCAPHCQPLMAENLDSLLQIGFVQGLSDGACVSAMCRVLKAIRVEHLDSDGVQDICCSLVQTLFEHHMSNAEWFEVAENAVSTLYTLFPSPDTLFEEILTEMAAAVSFKGSCLEAGPQEVGSDAFLRFCFLLGQVALHQMVYVEICGEIIKQRFSADAPNGDQDDPMGGEANQQELELERLHHELASELLSPDSLIGSYLSMISSICHALGGFLGTPLPVQIALTGALMKLMTIDAATCQQHICLIFTFLQNEAVEGVIRENLVLGVSDLMIRFPNLMEPWKPHLYELLSSSSPSVRRNALLVLTHLILSDMIKIKGHIAKIVILMVDDDPKLRSMSTNFIHELAQKATRSFNPIYNLFPDVLSNLLQITTLAAADFQTIIQFLLKFTNERHGEKLVEKLSIRFESEDRVKVWRGLAFSIKSLQLGEKGFKKWMELGRFYKRALEDEICFRHFRETCLKLKRNSKSQELKSLVQRFESELTAQHEELRSDGMEYESSRHSDSASELTFAVSEGDVTCGSDRKRKAEEQDSIQRRSEIRLLGGTSRLERIPEQRRSLEPTGRESDAPEVERRFSRLSISKELDT